MTARFLDSYDTVNSFAQIATRYSSSTLGNGGWSTNGRGGTGCLDFNHAGAAGNVSKVFDAQATWIVGHAVYLNNMPFGGTILELDDGDPSTTGYVQVRLRINNGVIEIRNADNTLVGSSDPVVTTGQYYYIELKATINTSGTFEVILDGNSVVSGTGNLNPHGNNSSDRIKITGSAKQYVDDLYILDGSGGVDNNFWGDTRVTAIFPTADGSTLQWTPSSGSTHYTLLNETAPNLTGYVSTSSSSQLDTYKFTSPSNITIKAVQQVIWSGTDSGTATIQGAITSGSNYFSNNLNLTTTAGAKVAIWPTNPATSTAWTPATINSAEFGESSV